MLNKVHVCNAISCTMYSFIFVVGEKKITLFWIVQTVNFTTVEPVL